MSKKDDARTFLISVAAELAGIKRIIELTNQVEALQSRLAEMADELDRLRMAQHREAAATSTALVLWQPRKGPRR